MNPPFLNGGASTADGSIALKAFSNSPFTTRTLCSFVNLSSTPPTETTKPSTLLLAQTISSVSSRAEFQTNSALSTTTSILPMIFPPEHIVPEAPIFSSRLARVAFMTQGLKVCFIPHQKRIASMRFDVVNVSRQSDDSLLLAFNTKRMRFKDPCAKALPSIAIASSG